MARRGRGCVVAGCKRTAAVGSVVCAEHRDTALGEQTDREIMMMTQRLAAMARYEDQDEKRAAIRQFRRQVMRGDYAALFSTEMMRALDKEGSGYGLRQEIGMMRLAMLRLLTEEDDPSRMAHGMARLSGALGKSMERQESWEKAAEQRRRASAFMELYGEVTRAQADPPAMMTPAKRPAELVATIEVEDAPVGEFAPAMEPEYESLEPQRPAYPDYAVDVDEWEESVWGQRTRPSHGERDERIARGRR